MEIHKILGNKVRVFRRDGSKKWYCSTSINGKEWKKSTKEESLEHAKDIAEDWYLGLQGQKRDGVLGNARTFEQAAAKFAEEYEAITINTRSPKWVRGHMDRIRIHLTPFFKGTRIDKLNAGMVQEYRTQRMTEPAQNPDTENTWKPPARNTLHNEIVTLRMILKTAVRHQWIPFIPDLSDPYRKQSKIEHRPWFTPNEYKQLYEATRLNAKHPKNTHYRLHAEQLHDFVLIMANTGLRPDEVKRLEYRDVNIVDDINTEEKILEIEVRGKRGVGYCKSMPGAVTPFERMLKRNKPKPMDLLFPNDAKKMFNNLLREQELKFDRHGKARTAYSLRHSYICFRLLEGADIYQVAKNCRTSVEMIEKYYAAHLKDMIDTSLVNVRRTKNKKV
tara:strand:- start:1997 stop:3166 length:1170 start_codon:yes stop_codon:yes gene_type:complete